MWRAHKTPPDQEVHQKDSYQAREREKKGSRRMKIPLKDRW